MPFENIDSTAAAKAYEDASHTFHQELRADMQERPPVVAEPPPPPVIEQPRSPQDLRADYLIHCLDNPAMDRAQLAETLRHTFLQEMNADGGLYGYGVQGMYELADKVSRWSGYGVSVHPFRSSQRVYALTVTDPQGYSEEIPLTGR